MWLANNSVHPLFTNFYDSCQNLQNSRSNEKLKRSQIFFTGPPDPPAGIPNVCCSTATINWRSSPYDGGCTVTGYTVEMNRAGGNTWMTIAESCLSLSLTIPTVETETVTPGERYRFRVRAENIHGVSEPGQESEFVRIPKEGETCLQNDEEGKYELVKEIMYFNLAAVFGFLCLKSVSPWRIESLTF